MDSLRRVEQAIEVAQAINAMEQDWYGHPQLVRYPRDITALVQASVGLEVVSIPGLTPDKALHYLRVAGGYDIDDYETLPDDEAPGSVSTILYVGPPQSLAFIESNLPASLANYSLAREICCYIAAVFDCWGAWNTNMFQQTGAIEDAFDWSSPDTWLELRGLQRHLPGCTQPSGKALRAMRRAEMQGAMIARELLAPWYEVSAIYGPGGLGANRPDMVRLLMERYGLPALVAAEYCDDLQTARQYPPPAPWTHTPPFLPPYEAQPLVGEGLPGLTLSDFNSPDEDESEF